ncbi:MAG: response regulator [Deltaproteobacteria bacterium]|nr:response regulator [Deltaproteobacteria bacterium]
MLKRTHADVLGNTAHWQVISPVPSAARPAVRYVPRMFQALTLRSRLLLLLGLPLAVCVAEAVVVLYAARFAASAHRVEEAWTEHALVEYRVKTLASGYVRRVAGRIAGFGGVTDEQLATHRRELDAARAAALDAAQHFSVDEQQEEAALSRSLVTLVARADSLLAHPNPEDLGDLLRFYDEDVAEKIEARVTAELDGAKRSTEEADRATVRALAVAGGIGGMLLLAGLMLGVGLLRQVSASLGRLQAGARRLAAGDLDHRIEGDSSAELHTVAAALNDMAHRLREDMVTNEELEAQVRQRTAELQRFAADLEASLQELRDTQSQLLLSDRLASVGALAAGVAHEINNPLAFIIANLNFAAQAHSECPAQTHDHHEMIAALNDAMTGAQRVLEIVRDLRMFSRADDDSRGPVNVQRVLESALNMAWNQIKYRARLVKDFGAVPEVEGTDGRLAQVFLNLAVNAVQAMPDRDVAANEIRVVTRATADRVVVEFRDNGTGISQAAQARIFQPFFTTKPAGQGTGLGLAISKRIVETMGGEISFETTVGAGTTFRVALPLAKAPGAGVAPVHGAAAPQAPRARILVIDDEVMVGRALQRVFQGHDVVAVTNGREALAHLKAGERFDVIFCDLMMPGMTGMDLYAELARDAPADAARLVFLTGGASTPAARAFLEQVPNRKAEKPIDPDGLRRMLAQALEARGDQVA